jgi:hypothetical protein
MPLYIASEGSGSIVVLLTVNRVTISIRHTTVEKQIEHAYVCVCSSCKQLCEFPRDKPYRCSWLSLQALC